MANKLAIFLTIAAIVLYHAQANGQTHTGSPANTKILVYGAVGSHSTRISMFPFMEALAERGYNVTFLSAFDNFEDPNKRSKIHYYTPEKWKQSMGDWEDHMSFFDVRRAGISPDMWMGIQDIGAESCEILYSDPEFVEWVKTSEYDLVIAESACNECAYGLAHLFNAKLIVYGTSTLFPWFQDTFGFADETSSIPDSAYDFSVGKDQEMTFVERLKNAVSPIRFAIYREYFYLPKLEKITRNALGLTKDQLPSFREIERKVSLVFLSSDFTIDYPRSMPPHVINIGGAVAGGKTEKPLSPEVKKFLDSAKDSGFVYISFGTVAEFTNFDREVQLEFIQALGSFPKIKFLWKASIQINETLPDNVLLTKWAPQQTVLGHPNIKAFITHSGRGSVTEAVHFGVPLVLLPVLAEQDFNANVMAARGVGIKLEVLTLTKQQLEHAISQVLYTDKYRTAMTLLSKAFRDRSSQPLETAMWWIEYILRHPNSNDYLVPLSVHQPWWKRRQLDVWLTLAATLLLASSLALLTAYVVIKTILKKVVFPTPTRKNTKSKVKAN